MALDQIKEWTFYMQAAQFVIMIGGFIWVALSNKQKANTAAIEDLTRVTATAISDLRKDVDEETEKLGNRITKLETKLEHMPGHEDLGDIHSRVNEAAQRLTSMEGELKQMNNTMHLMHQHLMNRGEKS